MRLFELFDKVANFTKTLSYYEFDTSSGTQYFVQFGRIYEYNPKEWYAKYENIVEDSVEINFAKIDSNGKIVHTLTNTGDAFEVMATVLKIIEDYLQNHEPPSIYFTGDRSDGGRTKLYDRLADKINNIKGYRLVEKTTFGRNYLYIFKRD